LNSATGGDIVLLDCARGDIFVQRKWAEYVMPIVKYLESRPPGERYLGYDGQYKTVAFLAGRTIEIDYLQRHRYREVGEDDIREVLALARKRRIDTILLGKPSLAGTPAERELFDYLDLYYQEQFKTDSYRVYQRKPGD
jgi:hypothetical protein